MLNYVEDAIALGEAVHEATAGELSMDFVARADVVSLKDIGKALGHLDALLREIGKGVAPSARLQWDICSWSSWKDEDGKHHFKVTVRGEAPGGTYSASLERAVQAAAKFVKDGGEWE